MATGLQGNTLWAAPCDATDLTGDIFCACTINPDTGLVILATTGGIVTGIIIEDGSPGNPITFQCDGVAKVILGATTNAGVRVSSDSNGHAVASAHNDFEFGTTLTGGDAGDVVSVLLSAGRAVG